MQQFLRSIARKYNLRIQTRLPRYFSTHSTVTFGVYFILCIRIDLLIFKQLSINNDVMAALKFSMLAFIAIVFIFVIKNLHNCIIPFWMHISRCWFPGTVQWQIISFLICNSNFENSNFSSFQTFCFKLQKCFTITFLETAITCYCPHRFHINKKIRMTTSIPNFTPISNKCAFIIIHRVKFIFAGQTSKKLSLSDGYMNKYDIG